MVDLRTQYLGMTLKNPVIAGSCGLTDNVDSMLGLEKAGASAIVLKSLFEEEILSELQINFQKMNNDLFLYPETVDYYEYLEAPKEYARQLSTTYSRCKTKPFYSCHCKH